MSQSTSYGTVPTAYGVSVEIFRNADVPESDPMAFWLKPEAAAVMGGVYYPQDRQAFVAASKASGKTGGVPVKDLAELGWRPIPKVAIAPAEDPVYDSMPTVRTGPIATEQGLSIRDCADGIATDMGDRHRWCDRAEYLMGFLANQLPVLGGMPRSLGGTVLAKIFAAVLELQGEREIDCLEQAAFYALTDHQPWRSAGRSWLLPFRKTWVADWIEARPDFRRAANLVSHAHPDVPSWLGSVTR